MNIHERIEEQMSLAKCYADDGALFSAARVLRGLAQEVQTHAEACHAAEQAELDEDKYRAREGSDD